MSVVAEFTIPTEALPGGDALVDHPEATIQVERIVPTGHEALPFFWVFDADTAAFFEQLRDEPEIDALERLAETNRGVLCRSVWTPRAQIIEGITTLDPTILDAIGTAEEWFFRVRAPTSERLLVFKDLFTEHGIPVELRRLYDFAEIAEVDRSLTPEQQETLLVAYQEGYFDQPRQITQAELGEHFGISGRAVSNRLRRATKNLVTNSLVEPTNRDLP